MDNVLIDRSASGFDFRRRAGGDGDGRWNLAVSLPPLPPRPPRGTRGSFPYHAAARLPPVQYAPTSYNLYSSLSLPPPPPRRAPLAPLPPAAAMARYASLPAAPAAARVRAGAGECKRKKPRATADGPPKAQRRRKPLERAAPLPPQPAVNEALDDLEREAARGFVEDLMHALAPPPSSLPLPTFSLVRAAAAKVAAASSAV